MGTVTLESHFIFTKRKQLRHLPVLNEWFIFGRLKTILRMRSPQEAHANKEETRVFGIKGSTLYREHNRSLRYAFTNDQRRKSELGKEEKNIPRR